MLLLDAHVHVYPFYDLSLFLDSAVANMPLPDPSARRVLALAERRDCHFFASLLSGSLALPAPWRVTGASPAAIVLSRGDAPDAPVLTFLPGRQIVPRERIELCALGSDASIPDGLSAGETFDAILAARALPVLNWAPGKWLFKRARVVSDLMARRPLALCETSLRPLGWPTPLAIRRARRLGLPVFAGSDPLPVPGEEPIVAACHALLGLPSDTAPSSLPSLLSQTPPLRLVLSRPTPLALHRRLSSHKKSRL